MHLKAGRFPESLDQLVPNYLGEVATDPFDGRPLRFTRTTDGVVIYSVGENGVDDGGSVVPGENERWGKDFGFRLLHPDRRKLRLRPPAPPEDH